MKDFNINIGKKLKALRLNKGYSLAKLEEITGVSKSMLGQVERGESNPTVKTLWKISQSLNVTFSFFLSTPGHDVSVISIKKSKALEEDSHYRVYPLIPYDNKKGFELYLIEMEGFKSHDAEPHFSGVEEFVMVNQGVLEIKVNEKNYRVEPGELIHFPADRPHTYSNKSISLLKANVLVYYPLNTY